MTPLQIAANPFALMIDPDAIFAAMATSDRLQRLKSRVCRPLDKPTAAPAAASDVTAMDAAVDAEVEVDFPEGPDELMG